MQIDKLMIRRSRISPISKKRAKERITYKQLFTKMDQEAKANNLYVCFFCGKGINGIANHHHLRGRENSMLNEPQYLVLAHNDCHLGYHRMTVDQLKQQPWFDEWMDRLRIKDPESYSKELRKREKTIPLNPSLFQDEEDIF